MSGCLFTEFSSVALALRFVLIFLDPDRSSEVSFNRSICS